MEVETLSFRCPACGIQLTVPARLAGVVGPCPSCHTQIQAPPVAAPQPPAPQPSSQAAQPPPQPAPPLNPPPASQHTPEQPPQPARAAVRIEPRSLPNRTHGESVVAKPIPDSAYRTSGSGKHTGRHHDSSSSLISRLAILLVMITAAVALAIGLWTVLKQQPGGAPPTTPLPGESEEATTQPITPAAPPSQAETGIQPLPTPAPDQPELNQPAIQDSQQEPTPALDALAILEKFLVAKTLEERLPLIESRIPAEQLAGTCLATPLPPATSVVIDSQSSSPIEQVVDFFYQVDFQQPDGPANLQTLLVRTRGNNPPKVVVDPFLDLFGGRLASYATTPTDKGGQFHVIVYPLPNCTNTRIKDREKKMTLKLLARENAQEITQAYCSKISKIGEMFTDGSHRLSFGKHTASTIMLRWNTEDDPANPYLEAFDIKSFDWNP